MNAINLLEVENLLQSINPMQLIRDVGDIRMTLHKIKYTYTTVRGNKKDGIKYLITDSINPQIDLNAKLLSWVEEFNNNKPHRAISNVKFLEGSCVGLITI
ncbi:MAG: hypothetical protein RSC24_06790 [Clostridium sp.]